MCWFGHVQRMGENRIVCVGLGMYREWKKIELYVLVLTCTENGRKLNSQKSIIYEFFNFFLHYTTRRTVHTPQPEILVATTPHII